MEVVCSKAEMRLIETQQRRKWPMKKTFHFSSRLGTIRELDCVRSSKKKKKQQQTTSYFKRPLLQLRPHFFWGGLIRS